MKKRLLSIILVVAILCTVLVPFASAAEGDAVVVDEFNRTTPCSQLKFDVKDSSYIVAKVGGNFVVWTSEALTQTQQAEFVNSFAVVAEGPFANLHLTKVLEFISGQTAYKNGAIAVTQEGDLLIVNFSKPSDWAQFAYGGFSLVPPETAKDVFYVRHYFENDAGDYVLAEQYNTSGEIIEDETKAASGYVLSVDGYDYEADHDDAVSLIAFDGEVFTPGNTLKLYYGKTTPPVPAEATFYVRHYFQDEDGNYILDALYNKSGVIIEGESKAADAYIETVSGYTYEPEHFEAVSLIAFDGEDFTPGNTLRLFYGRASIVEPNEADFFVEHYFENEDGDYVLDDRYNGSGIIVEDESRLADDYILSIGGYTYEADHDDAVSEITFDGEGFTPGDTLKLYYGIDRANIVVEHWFEQEDGTFVKDALDDTAEIKFGQTIESDGFMRTADGYVWDKEYQDAVNSTEYTEDGITEEKLILYYLLGETIEEETPPLDPPKKEEKKVETEEILENEIPKTGNAFDAIPAVGMLVGLAALTLRKKKEEKEI